MITRHVGTWLKRYSNMTQVERDHYLTQVAAWVEACSPTLSRCMDDATARFSTALQCSVGWSDAVCRAWEEGVMLMSAFAANDAMFAAAYTDSARETIRWMTKGLSRVGRPTPDPSRQEGEPAGGGSVPAKRKRGRPRKEESARMAAGAAKEALWQPGQPAGETAGTGAVGGCGSDDVAVGGRGSDGVMGGRGGGLPVRPKHIDQYVHLLPKKTQERAALVKGLLDQLDEAREKARLLIGGGDAAARAQWMAAATQIDGTLHRIYKELDEEWAKLVKAGRVVVDDLGNARVIDADNGAARNTEMQESRIVEEEKAAQKGSSQRRLLRKWLVDTRRGNGDTRAKHVKKWREHFAEYVAIEGDAAFEDERILAAAKHYGIQTHPRPLPSEGGEKDPLLASPVMGRSAGAVRERKENSEKEKREQ